METAKRLAPGVIKATLRPNDFDQVLKLACIYSQLDEQSGPKLVSVKNTNQDDDVTGKEPPEDLTPKRVQEEVGTEGFDSKQPDTATDTEPPKDLNSKKVEDSPNVQESRPGTVPRRDSLYVRRAAMACRMYFDTNSIRTGELLVSDIRERYGIMMNISAEYLNDPRIQLFHEGRLMENSDAKVRDYGVKDDSHISVVLPEGVGSRTPVENKQHKIGACFECRERRVYVCHLAERLTNFGLLTLPFALICSVITKNHAPGVLARFRR